jgi:hypothetical protein
MDPQHHKSKSFWCSAAQKLLDSRAAHSRPDFYVDSLRAHIAGREYMQTFWEPAVRCALDERVGRAGDGGKYVCNPSCLLPVGNCTVMSIGSNNDFSFETALESHRCSVHTFDHTVASPQPPSTVSFHSLGVASASAGTLRTLRQLYNETGWAGRQVDVLKLDCEGCEYGIFMEQATLEFLSSHVRQLLLEVHYTNAEATARLAQNLWDAGFRTFSKEANVQHSDGSCVEFSMINSKL